MKKFISGLLGILFVVLVVVGVFICTYVFNQPSRSGDSRELISGTWTDKDANITLSSLTRAISLSLTLITNQLSQRAGLKFRRTGKRKDTASCKSV